MEVILLEKIRNLGDIGEKVSVKTGHARNYLVPHGKAVMATAANVEKFAKMRAELEQHAAEVLKAAQERATKFADVVVTITNKATEEGKLFGSITTSTIASALKDMGFDVKRSEVSMPQGPIRHTGEFEIVLLLHTDVTAKIKVIVVADKE
ncbi:MAG: 50S ribosomal protein L9 [uncultured bacterium]|nr:MAG: 50S ribosomal protein L9 [uncultured bacterium]